MSTESGPPTTKVLHTDDQVGAGHHGKYLTIGDKKLAQLEDL